MRWPERWRCCRVLAAALAALFALDARSVADGAGGSAAAAYVRFTATQQSTPLEGSFAGFRIAVTFDPANPAGGAVHAQVETGSVDGGAAQANALLRSADFFDSARFPVAAFDASGFQPLGPGRYQAQGSLALKGRRVAMPLVFAVAAVPQGRWFDGSFELSRLDYGIGQGEWTDTATLDDRVTVRFHVLQAAAAP